LDVVDQFAHNCLPHFLFSKSWESFFFCLTLVSKIDAIPCLFTPQKVQRILHLLFLLKHRGTFVVEGSTLALQSSGVMDPSFQADVFWATMSEVGKVYALPYSSMGCLLLMNWRY
jgi:hypothetical protein